MKIYRPHWKMSACLAGAALTWLGSITVGQAALTGSLTLRPLTPTEIKTYGLTNPPAQSSGGMKTIGIGEPAYLEALVNIRSNNTTVVWTLTSKPAGSSATILPSPLGTNLPVYNPADKLIYRTADRAFLRPDVVGFYTVNAAINTVGSGSTNVSITLCGATYLGLGACAGCHSGNFASVPNLFSPYTNTAHASAFQKAVDGISTDHFGKNCISCHVVGYDTNSFANNGGFDDVAAILGWTLPTVMTNGTWANMPEQLKNVSNIQCENCHGPGSQHMYSQGKTGNTNAITVTFAAGDCNKCHDALSHHVKGVEWNASRHAIATRSPSGPSRSACVRCHTAGGFEQFVSNAGNTNGYTTNTVFEAITCQACHDPHDATNPHQLRAANVYTLPEGTTVTNVGLGALCMNCHHSRNGSATNNVLLYSQNKPTWAGGVSFGPHDSTAGDMVEGVNGIDYGKPIPSGSHSTVIPDVCVGCHMQEVATTSPAFGQAGGHTFGMTYNVVSGGVTNHMDLVEACVKCHGDIEEFNMVRKDYNGDGVIEGIQTEVQRLLDRLSTLLPNSTYRADGNYVADGLVKVIDGRTTVKTNWQTKFLNGAWNHMFVSVEGSRGIHNAPYAVGLLKASIADLTGDSNNDGLPDSWQIAYFGAGFATNSASAPGAVNNTAGVPNWMMSTMGLDPRGAFTVAGNSGVIMLNGANIVNGATNTITIYKAAEIVFDTQVGTTYQIQGVSQLTSSWSNISTNIPGTGGSVSYLTPTRGTNQMFFRVVQNP